MISPSECSAIYKQLLASDVSVPSGFVALQTSVEGIMVSLGAQRLPRVCFAVDSRCHTFSIRSVSAYLTVHCTDLRLAIDGFSSSARCVILDLTGDDSSLKEYFWTCVCAVASGYSFPVSAEQIAEALDGFAELFRHLRTPSLKTVRGLWSELLTIALASDSAVMLHAWTGKKYALFDFSASDWTLEVKSCVGTDRVHTLKHDQIASVSHECAYFASVPCIRSDDGWSIADLVDYIAAKPEVLHSDYLYILECVAGVLGCSVLNVNVVKFSVVEAANSVRFVRTCDIPRLQCIVPLGVSNIQYSVDFSTCSSTSIAGLHDPIRSVFGDSPNVCLS